MLDSIYHVLLEYFEITFLGYKVQDIAIYCEICVKWPLKNRQNKDLNDKW